VHRQRHPLRTHRWRLLQDLRPPRGGCHEFNADTFYFDRKFTGALVGVQPFGGFGMSGTDSKAGGPDYLLLHRLAKTVVERFR